MRALIEEIAKTEPPGDILVAPPDEPDSTEDTGEIIHLPSQRGGILYIYIYMTRSIYKNMNLSFVSEDVI